MIRKFLVYCQSDGLRPALAFAFKTLAPWLFGRSTTLFFHLGAYEFEKSPSSDLLKQEQIDIQRLNSLNFPRLRLLPCDEWLTNGSRLYVTFATGNRPVAFTWTHFHQYSIHGLGNIHLSDNECWIGPTFVHKEYRGKGINKAQILHQMAEAQGMTFYTSVNAKNLPSIHSFLHFGFKEIGRTVAKRNLLRQPSTIEVTGKIKEKISL